MANAAAITPSPVTSIMKMRKGSAVYHAVKRAILTGEQKPGATLVEQSIARQMGCSQGTVREALLRLNEENLVERRGYQGTVVSETTIEVVTEMARIRLDLETFGMRRVAPRFTKANADQVTALLDEMEAAYDAGDDYALSEIDRNIHLTIFRLAGLRGLEAILARCALHMHRYTFGNTPKNQGGRRPATEHAEILQALIARDGEAAAIAVAHHLRRVIRHWSPTLDAALTERQAIAGPGL
jgi:GntR family transcriptional regulator, rspAB operon transcriptional repressor